MWGWLSREFRTFVNFDPRPMSDPLRHFGHFYQKAPVLPRGGLSVILAVLAIATVARPPLSRNHGYRQNGSPNQFGHGHRHVVGAVSHSSHCQI